MGSHINWQRQCKLKGCQDDIPFALTGDSDDKESACNAGDLGLTLEEWQPTPVFLPGKSRGQRNLADCSPRYAKSPT